MYSDSLKSLLKMLLVLILLTSFTGCATLYVQTQIKDNPNSSSYLDLSQVEKCEYQGREPEHSEQIRVRGGSTIIFKNEPYGRLLITDKNETEYILLIPMNDNLYDLSIWWHPSKKESSIHKPVEVIFNPPVAKGIKNMMSLLPPESWQGYPSKIILYNEKNEERIYIAYRKGPNNDDICWSIADATDFYVKLGETGRSIAKAVLTPVAIATDVVTIPLQAAAMAAACHTSHRSEKCDPHSYINSVAFSHDGKFAISGNSDNAIKVWNIETGKKIRVFKGHSDEVRSITLSPDGRYLLSGSWDGTIKLWHYDTGVLIYTFPKHKYSVTLIAFSPDGRYFLSSGGSYMELWDISSTEKIRTFERNKPSKHQYGSEHINSIAISPNGRYALSANSKDEILLWDIESGNNIKTFIGHHDFYINDVKVSPNGQYALSGSNDGTMKLWEVESGWEIRSIAQNSGYVYSVAFSPDGRYIISGNGNGRILLWELSSGRLIRTFGEHSGRVSSVAFSPDGHMILSGSSDETLKVWDLESGKEIRTFKAEPEKIPPRCK